MIGTPLPNIVTISYYCLDSNISYNIKNKEVNISLLNFKIEHLSHQNFPLWIFLFAQVRQCVKQMQVESLDSVRIV